MTQKQAMDLLMMGKNVFLTGQAGSGKTYLLNQFIGWLKENKIPAAVTASTGIAATHLNGQTIHSWSGIGIRSTLTPTELKKISGNPNLKTKIQKARVLIIDEISMFHGYRLDMVNQVCREIRRDGRPFGGMQVILCGDFFQLPPINEENFPERNFAFRSTAWEELAPTICYLSEQHRQWDEDYLKVLNDIRSSEVNEATYERLAGRMHKKPEDGLAFTRLFTHNRDVDAINNAQLAKINKPARIFRMEEEGIRELAEALKKGCLAPEELVLKEGAAVMFVKNNPYKGYMNGTLGTVTGWDDDGWPVVTTNNGPEITVYPASWMIEDDDKTLAEICQVPLRLAWAITVHKSQGMSLDAAVADLSKSFTYGMGYVALSRVKSLSGLCLLGINQTAFLVDQEIAEADRRLRAESIRISLELEKMKKSDIKMMQAEYLKQIINQV